jgi:hypothetical protein
MGLEATNAGHWRTNLQDIADFNQSSLQHEGIGYERPNRASERFAILIEQQWRVHAPAASSLLAKGEWQAAASAKRGACLWILP